MPFTAHDPRVFYNAVAAQLASSTGKQIGRTYAPTNETTPYAVVYEQDESDVESTLADPHDLTVFEWLVMSVGDSTEQAQWMQQKCRSALLGWQPVVAGLNTGFVVRDGGGPVIPDDAVQPPKFSVTDRFICLVD